MSVDLVLGSATNNAVPMNINDNGTLGTPQSLPLAAPSTGANTAGLMSPDDKTKVDNSIQNNGNPTGPVFIGTKVSNGNSLNFITSGNLKAWFDVVTPNLYIVGLANMNTPDYSLIRLNNAGTVISRNVADSSPALYVIQQNTGSTGNTLTLQKGSSQQLSMSSSGNLKVNNLAGTGTRMVTADSTGILGASAALTVDGSGNVVVSNNIEVSGSVTGIPGMGPLSLYSAPGIKLSNSGYGVLFYSPSLTSDQMVSFPDASGTTGIVGTTAPASATDTGTVGEIRVTSTYVYFCIATDTWVRAPFATW